MTFKALITPDYVREVINTSLGDDEIKGLIAAAATLIQAKTSDYSIDGSTQVEMTRWTAAHFVAIKGSMTSTTSSSSTQTFTTSVMKEKIGDATMCGQTAIMFDPTGHLDNLGGKPPRVVALTDV